MHGDAVEDIKQRLSIEEVIGEYVELKRAGRNLKALSPFGNEKTPSFMVSPEKQIWHDFSSNKGGNMFSFVMEMEGVDFRGALEILARKAGIDLSQYGRSSKNSGFKKRLYEVLELATRYYQQALIKSSPAIEYLVKKRAFTKSSLQDFRIGYAPDQFDALTKLLLKKDFTADELKRAGLSVTRRGQLSDMFLGRIMVPLMDQQGQVIGFTARLLDDRPEAPKYINTPQTLLYDKGRHVYGLSQAKQAIRSSGYVVMVEGNLDVIASHQAGIRQVVATAGTALTEAHLISLQRLSEDIRIAFDRDNAGLKATERAIELALKAGLKLQVIDVPDGKDPDELVRKDPMKWEQVVNQPMYSLDWLRLRKLNESSLSSAAGKRTYSDALLRIISLIQDSVEQEHYVRQLARDTDVSFEAMLTKFRQLSAQAPKKLRASKGDQVLAGDPYAYQDQLLGLLWLYPITRRVLETIDEEPTFGREERSAVFDYIALHPHDNFDDRIPKKLHKYEDYVKIITLLAEELYATFDVNERLREAQDLVRRLATDHKKVERQRLSQAIKSAELSGDEETVAKLLEEFNQSFKEN